MLLFPTNGKGKQTYYRYYYYYSSSPFLPLPSLIIRHVKKGEKMGGGREREREKSLLFPGWMGRPQWIIPGVGFINPVKGPQPPNTGGQFTCLIKEV